MCTELQKLGYARSIVIPKELDGEFKKVESSTESKVIIVATFGTLKNNKQHTLAHPPGYYAYRIEGKGSPPVDEIEKLLIK